MINYEVVGAPVVVDGAWYGRLETVELDSRHDVVASLVKTGHLRELPDQEPDAHFVQEEYPEVEDLEESE